MNWATTCCACGAACLPRCHSLFPRPPLIGTLGAFIRIKSPIRSRADLFDIGIAGPIAGFVVAVPVMIYGLLASKLLTGDAAAAAAAAASNPSNGSMLLGFPLIFKLAHWIMAALGSQAAIAQAPVTGLYLHPVAMAAWVGMLATSLNLLPGASLMAAISFSPSIPAGIGRSHC